MLRQVAIKDRAMCGEGGRGWHPIWSRHARPARLVPTPPSPEAKDAAMRIRARRMSLGLILACLCVLATWRAMCADALQ